MTGIEYIDTVRIAQHWLPVLVNGDTSHLEANEEHQIEQWLAARFPDHNCLTWDYGDESISARDSVTGLQADCVEVRVHGHPTGDHEA